MTELVLVPPHLIEAAWPHLEAIVNKLVATAKGRLEASDAKRLALADLMQIWVSLDEQGMPTLVLAGELKQYPRAKEYHLIGIAGGHYDESAHHLETIETWAYGLGCERVRIIDGRKGWARKLPRYRVTNVILERELP